MKRRLAIILTALCSMGLFGAAAAQASSEYYYNANLGGWGAVSGVPRNTLYFLGVYTHGGWEYCTGVQVSRTYEGINSLQHTVCGEGTSLTTSFASQFGRGVTQNGFHEQHFLSEERW